MKLNEIVQNLIRQHTGGEQFFDALDNELRNHQDLLTLLHQKARAFEVLQPNYPAVIGGIGYVMSGKFGLYAREEVNGLLVNGGLRKGEPCMDLEPLLRYFKEGGIKDFIFVDDSFYSGKTRDTIAAELAKHGCRIIQTFVVYDGSITQDTAVQSLYRYHP